MQSTSTFEIGAKEFSPSIRHTLKPPVLILGCSVNALSVARSLGKKGIDAYVSATQGNHVLYSRYCKRAYPFPPSMSKILYWKELLFGHSETLRGSILFACNDDAVEFLATHYDELREHYLLDTIARDVHLAMLNKARTLELAASLGIGIPRFWYVRHSDYLSTILSETTFPVIVKPVHSHLFLKQFKNKKYFSAANEDELMHWLEICRQKNVNVIISEWIPGPDHLLFSYFTYITESGEPLLHYTKRIIHRFLANAGLACLHVTEWIPEVADLGWKFFSGIKYRGWAMLNSSGIYGTEN